MKKLVINARDNLRKKGIRVSNDLTYMQREQLKTLNREGRAGYFKNGKLFVRPPKTSQYNEQNGQRLRLTARRPNVRNITQENTNEIVNQVNEQVNVDVTVE